MRFFTNLRDAGWAFIFNMGDASQQNLEASMYTQKSRWDKNQYPPVASALRRSHQNTHAFGYRGFGNYSII
jgi:hypothetical protein